MRALVYKSEGVFKEREAPLPGGINLKKSRVEFWPWRFVRNRSETRPLPPFEQAVENSLAREGAVTALGNYRPGRPFRCQWIKSKTWRRRKSTLRSTTSRQAAVV